MEDIEHVILNCREYEDLRRELNIGDDSKM